MCGLLKLSLVQTQQLFLFSTLRTVIASAVRLGNIGPLQVNSGHSYAIINNYRTEYRLILSRRSHRPSWLKSDGKIEQDNCFIIQQIVNETDFAARRTVVVQR